MGWHPLKCLNEVMDNRASNNNLLPSDRTMPTRTDSNMHGLLPQGPHNIGASDSRDSQERRLHSPEPEAGAGPGPEMRFREIRLQVWGSCRGPNGRHLHLCRLNAAEVEALSGGYLLPHSARMPCFRG